MKHGFSKGLFGVARTWTDRDSCRMQLYIQHVSGVPKGSHFKSPMLQLLRVVCGCSTLHWGQNVQVISKLSFHAPCYRRGMFSLFSLVVRDIFLNLLQISLFELPFPMDYHECQHKMTIYFWIPYRSNIETL